MTPYELEAWAFSLDKEERAEAFLVVADAFEMVGALDSASIRRSWADQLVCGETSVKVDPPLQLIGYYYNIEDVHLHWTQNGTYRSESTYIGWSRDLVYLPLTENRPPKEGWYLRKGHWNRRKMLMKMSLEEIRKWNETR